MRGNSQSPAELHRRFCSGEKQVVGDLFDDLYRIVKFKYDGFSQADCEEIADDTLLDAVVGVEDLKDPNAFWGWLKKIALNKAYHLSKKRGEHRREVALDDVYDVGEEDFVEQLISNVSLSEALGRLNPSEYNALVLTAIDRLTYEEASRLTGRSKDSIAQSAARARKRMRRMLGDFSVENA